MDKEKEPTPTINSDTCITVQQSKSDQSKQRAHHNCSAGVALKNLHKHLSLFRGLVVKNISKLLGINRIYQMKLIHVRTLELLPRMCTEGMEDRVDLEQRKNTLRKSMFLAVEHGIVEYIAHICRAKEDLLLITNENGRNMFQYAAECREPKVYSLIYGLGDLNKNLAVSQIDNFGNNMLHIVGTLSSSAQFNRIRGAALQMQRELQWFKEVKSNIADQPENLEFRNKTDYMTPDELFTKNHKELAKEGEKSMKETATSCTVVGALIVTIMFAAAFTVPGGNNGDTGLPIFLEERVFITFMVSDAISLFSSTTSVMIFLGILTSRYAEDDFLKSLPTKMILGLFTLFLSSLTMMIAFSSALYIMLHENLSIVIPIILFASAPITSFIWMQFPFLIEMFISTYGPGIFDRKVKDWL